MNYEQLVRSHLRSSSKGTKSQIMALIFPTPNMVLQVNHTWDECRTVLMNFNDHESVLSVKKRLRSAVGMPVNQQRLSKTELSATFLSDANARFHVLEDENLLTDYGIQAHDELFLIIRRSINVY